MNTKRGSKRLRAAIVQQMDKETRNQITGIGVRHEENCVPVTARNIMASNHYLVEWDCGGERHVLYLWMNSRDKHPERFAGNVLRTMSDWPSNKAAAKFFADLSKTIKGPIGITIPYSSWHAVFHSKDHPGQCFRARMAQEHGRLIRHPGLQPDIKHTAVINTLAKSFSAACQVDTLLMAQLAREGMLEGHAERSRHYEDGDHTLGSLPIHVSGNGLKQIIAAHRLGGSDTGDILYEDGNILVEGINVAQTVLAGLAGQNVSSVTGRGTRFDDETIAAARNTKQGGTPTLLLKMQSRRLTLKKAQRTKGCPEPDMPHVPSLQEQERYKEYVTSLAEGAILSDDATFIENWLDRGKPPLRPPRYTDPQQVEKFT